MMQHKIVSIIAAAAMATAAAAQQKPAPAPAVAKIGFVNTERLQRESRTAQKARQELEDKFQKRAKEIDEGPQNQIERRRIALEEEMRVEREDALRQFVDRTNRIIRQVALAEDFDAVFLEAAYSNARIDITDKVIKELDAGR
jgi:outer membrane protein